MEENIATISDEAALDTPAAESAAAIDATVPQKKKRKPINQQKLQDNIWGWVFCVPLIIGTVWFIYSAFIMAVLISFTNYSIGQVDSGNIFAFLGKLGDHIYTTLPVDDEGFAIPGATATAAPFHWYAQIFTETINPATGIVMNEMGAYLFNTVFYMIGIPIGMVLSMFFAVCMSRDIKGGNLFRVLYYVPCVASTISIVYTFKIMFGQNGVINAMFGSNLNWLQPGGTTAETWAHLTNNPEATSSFMRNPFWCQGIISKTVIVIMSVWKGLGGTIILYVAGLSGVNAATKEAAQIDGASGWQIFWKVTMPDLYPVIFYNVVTSVIGGLQIYAEPVLLREESYLTSGYVSLIWLYGLQITALQPTANPSAGAAYGMFLAVIIFVLTLFQFWLDARNNKD